ncbi:MAG: DUF6377 domain-containing protein [Tannerellaceae bacterium]|nr:DUF6377 domain-containing protein [Tannerellaceae bacterium]
MLSGWSAPAMVPPIDSLLKELDKTIQERPRYEARKIEQLDLLKKLFQTTTSADEKFHISMDIFQHYKAFQMDSALAYAGRTLALAQLLDDPGKERVANLNMAEVLMITGMYKESFDILNVYGKTSPDDPDRSYIYHLYHSLYMLMADYTLSSGEAAKYKALEYQYKDSIISVLPEDNLGHMLTKVSRLMEENRYGEALDLAMLTYKTFQEDPHHIGLSGYTLAEVYRAMGDVEKEKTYLAISAIGDLRAGVKEYISLRQLAGILYEEGDINRAYRYIKCSMEDAIYGNARYRTLEISRMLPLINDTYDVKMKSEKRKLVLFLFIISLLSVVLILSTIYIIRQLKALIKARQSLRKINDDLKQANNELNELNLELSESNIVKEEYIGYVFNMCSAYIDKLDDFRKKVNRKLKAGQSKELLTMTNTSSFVGDELKELYRNFDLIFLNLYPDFVEEFNSLLQENEHIYPKEGELLSPELRIYALVRLGINDSVKIAAFLHYSPQTVYNYRLKVRNKAKVSKDNFPESVRQIGRLRE